MDACFNWVQFLSTLRSTHISGLGDLRFYFEKSLSKLSLIICAAGSSVDITPPGTSGLSLYTHGHYLNIVPCLTLVPRFL